MKNLVTREKQAQNVPAKNKCIIQYNNKTSDNTSSRDKNLNSKKS